MNKKNIVVFIFLLILLISFTASAQVEIGGEAVINSNINITNDTQIYLNEKLNIKLYLPESKETEVKVDFAIKNNQFGVNTNFQKLYIKRNFANYNLTLGRQPVSWSFGSLINPVDFSFGAEVMDKSTLDKYIDSAKLYLPINWKSGIEIVANPQLNNDSKVYEGTKTGIRLRTMFNDYDFSFNYIYDPTIKLDDRLGLSLKGDLGPIGLYSAVSFEKNDNRDEEIYLLGLDYSKTINYDQRLYLQGEIINISPKKIEDFTSVFTGIQPTEIYPDKFDFGNERYNLFLGNISYQINEFSSWNFMLAGNINNENLLFIPQYKNQLPGNIDLTINVSLTNEKRDEFSAKPANINFNLKYSF